MIKLEEDEAIDFQNQIEIIDQSFHNYIDIEIVNENYNLFKKFFDITKHSSFYDDEYYLFICKNFITKLIEIDNVIELIINLSRINCGLANIYENNNLVVIIGKKISENPKHFSSSWNESMLSDYMYTYYYLKASEIFNKKGLDGLIIFLKIITNKIDNTNEFIVPSILSNFMSKYIEKDRSSLKKILDNFGYINSVEKKAKRLLG